MLAVQVLKPLGMNGSVYTAHSLIHGLFERGAVIDDGQTALDLMTQCTGRSWCNMLANNATTSWEMWGAHEGTHSHPWATTPASAIASGLMGVRPIEPGWKKWIAKPAPGNLTAAAIVVPTLHGPIHARLNGTLMKGRFEMGLRVPEGTEATACVRKTAGEGERLLLNGVDLTAADALVMPEAATKGYLCVKGLRQRDGDAEHVLVRTA